MKFLRFLFIICCCFLAVAFYSSWQQQAPSAGEEVAQDERSPDFPGVHLKQYGTIYKSAQPTQDQLNKILNHYPVDVVIRLNKDTNGLTVEQEAAICDRHQVRFYYFNIEGDTRSTYTQIRNLLQGGNTLVHCRHGYDRTGVIMGLWMRDQGATNAEIIAFNQWENYLENKGEQYRKYWDAVFH